jgi:hypothetical protein
MATLLFRLIGLFGGGVFGSLAESVAAYLRQKASDDLARYQAGLSADSQIALARLNAEIEARKVEAQILAADRGWRVTAWIRPLLVYPCAIHFAAIVLDSIPFWTPFGHHATGAWAIARLPAPYDVYEQAIILSFFIARPFEKAARVFSAAKG